MNAIVGAVLHGEIISPDATVRVVGKLHPLRGDRIECQVAAGLSINEILSQVLADHPEMRARRDFAVHLDGHLIEQKNWRRVRVKPGGTVTFRPLLGNGNVWRTVATVVVAVAAFVIAPWAAGAISIAGMALTGTALSLATAAIAAGVMAAGALAINALFPVSKAALISNSEDPRQLNSIQGAQNRSDPGGPVNVILGTHRISPNYAAKPYTEIVGDDQYLRLLFCVGYGPLIISNLKIGETPIGSFDDVTVEIRQGFAGDPPITLYPGVVDEISLSILLENFHDHGGVDGPQGGEWQSQTTAPGINAIGVDFTATKGMFYTNPQTGNADDWSVRVSWRWRLVGTSAFTDMPEINFTRSTSPERRGALFYVPAVGQYEVQARKHTGYGGIHVADTIMWTALRGFEPVAPIAFPKPLALVALRIKATDQLSGVIDTFNCTAASVVNVFDGVNWIPNTYASQNPGDLFRHVLQGPANARPVPDSQLDLTSLQGWWLYCYNAGFQFNQVINSVGSVYDKLCDICAAGRAVPTFIDGKWGVIWDRPADSIVQHFTPRNSWGFSGQKAYAQQPHGWRVSFINELNGFTQDQRIVYDDGYGPSNATLFEGIQFPGITNPTLIWRHGRFHIAQARLRPEKISLTVGWENLICTRGDRVAVTHDVLLIGLNAGRVKSVVGQVVTFDETVIVAPSKTYGMSFRLAAQTSPIIRAVDPATAVGEYNSLTLVGDLTGIAAELASPGANSAGCLFGFGETAQQYAVYRVQSIAHQKDLAATLTLVDDAQAISTADVGTIPAYNPNITIPPDPFTLPPRDLKYLEVIDGHGASVRALVALTWQVPRFGKIASFQVQIRDDNSGGPWRTIDTVLPPATTSRVALAAAGVWSFRVRCVFIDGTASSWVTLDHLILQGLSAPPAPVTNLRVTFISGRCYLSWDDPLDPRTVPIEIRKGSVFASAQIINDNAAAPWQTVGDDTYWVSAYVRSPFGTRVYASPAQDIALAGSVAIENIVVRHDERAEGWTGSFSGSIGVDQADNFLRTSGSDDFLGRLDFLGGLDFIDGDGVVQGNGAYYSAWFVNIGGLGFCRISNDWTAIGISENDDFLGRADFIANVDFLGDQLSQYVRVRPIVRISLTGPMPTWGAWQVWSPDVYQGWMFQTGIQFEILTDTIPDPGVIAFLESWAWTIDVPDRLDSYQNLTVPAGGLAIAFKPTGAANPIPFNGGLNNQALPHPIQSQQNPNAGDQVTWTGLTLSGVTLQVMNAGSSVGGSGVNLAVRGY